MVSYSFLHQKLCEGREKGRSRVSMEGSRRDEKRGKRSRGNIYPMRAVRVPGLQYP